MRKYGRSIKGIIVLIITFTLVFPIAAFTGKQASYQELAAKTNLPKDAFISIPFDIPLQPDSITVKNIYVTDTANVKVPLVRSLSKDGKTLMIRPMRAYQSGKSYTLYIKNNLKYKNGKYLQKGIKQTFSIASLDGTLPSVSSLEQLKKLLEKAEQSYNYYFGGIRRGINITFDEAATAAAPQQTESYNAAKTTAAPDYSTTNLQVQGVDEADIAKTDGKYIYQINKNRIIVAEAYPAKEMKIADTILLENNLTPMEMYLDDTHLVLLGSAYNQMPYYSQETSSSKVMPYYGNATVKLLIFDTADKTNLKKIREVEVEGNYLSSRKVGSKVYLVTNKNINYYSMMNGNIKQEDTVGATPYYRDTAVKNDFIPMGYDKIKYFPEAIEANYMLVAGLDINNPESGTNINAYLGSGQNVYVSEQNLYVAVTKYDPIPVNQREGTDIKAFIMPDDGQQNTVVYRFSLNDGKPQYTGKGQVPGTILNQFSMDEHKDYFRIATTKGQIWRSDEGTSKNNVYTLDSNLKTAGRLEDIAPGEKIYSVRFMGDRAYMVTFKTVDPLFVIDLKDNNKPQILGALKIPGYSEYIHPYDENHIIGFGKDAVEVAYKDDKGNETGRTAYYLGMKIAMFDITDVNKPKELFTEKIGDRGTYSELLNNHKALLFSKEKNLLAFPVTVYEVDEAVKNQQANVNSMPPYGSFSFQGAYVYSLDLKNGFKLKGKITHIQDEEYKKAGSYWYDGNKNVERVLYIEDTLYTLSNSAIKANGLSELDKQGELVIP